MAGDFTKMYRDTVGRPELRSIAIGALYNDLEAAESKGNDKWAKMIKRQLHMLGEGDYRPGYDDGCTPRHDGGL